MHKLSPISQESFTIPRFKNKKHETPFHIHHSTLSFNHRLFREIRFCYRRANGSTEIIVADCDTDTILTGDDLEKFDSLFNAWVNNYNTNPITRLSSNTNDAKKLEQFPQLLNMGKKIIPCIITRLPDKNLFWTLTLYDELQDIDSLKSFDYTRGEQFRAQETLRKYVEAKLHKKKRVFNSDQEKIKAIRELAKEYGWEEDSTLSPREKDSILLNLDYEITEETFKFYKNGNNKE